MNDTDNESATRVINHSVLYRDFHALHIFNVVIFLKSKTYAGTNQLMKYYFLLNTSLFALALTKHITQ